ncbi:MAG: hypothetical protein ABJD07_13755 [Gemmatimonadaceae bacterium]
MPVRLMLPIIGLAAIAVVACSGGDKSSNPIAQAIARAGSSSGGSDRPDPCILISRAEAQKYLGPLAHDPYRIGGPGNPDPSGSVCEYRAVDGRKLRIEPWFKDGKMAMGALGMVGALTSKVFVADNGKTDTLEGTWDQAKWMFGHFFALKGDVYLDLDVSSSRAGAPGAADLASMAFGRLDHPLAYNSAAATATAPHPREPSDACALVTRAEAEAILGPLDGAPVPKKSGTQTQCTYHARDGGEGPTAVTISVGWRDGFRTFDSGKSTIGAFKAGVADPSMAEATAGKGGDAMDKEMAKDPDAQKFLGVLGSLAKKAGVTVKPGSAQLITDTLVAGPWSEGAIFFGMGLNVVKQDVIVQVDFGSAGLEKGKAIAAKAVSRL